MTTEAQRAVIELTLDRRVRWFLAGCGLAAIGVGTLANYLGKEGAPTVTLLVIGAIALLVAAAGRFPAKITVGDNSVEFGDEQVRRVVDATVDTFTSSQISQAAHTAVATPDNGAEPFQGAIGRRLAEYALFTAHILGVVERIGAEDADITIEDAGLGSPWSTTITSQNVVHIDARLRLDVVAATTLARQARKLDKSSYALVVARDVDPGVFEAFDDARRQISIFTWRENDAELEDLVRRQLAES